MKKEKEYKSFLDEESDYTVEVSSSEGEKKKKNTVISRQTKLIIALAAFLVVMIPVYAFVLVPMLSENGSSVQGEIPEPHHGEVLISGNSIGMMPMLSEDKIKEVNIKNKVTVKDGDGTSEKYEDWTIFFDAEDKLWGIKDYKGISYDNSALITILGYFTQMKVQDRIEFDSADEIKMSTYGFDEESMPVCYVITTTDGKEYTVTMGSKTPTSTGFYAYFTDENGNMRPTVYIISNYYASLINGSVFSLMAPTVTQMLDTKDYVPKHFAIYKGKNPYFEIKKLEGDELTNAETAKVAHLYTKIGDVVYEYDASADYSNFLYEVLRHGITGSKVVYAKPDSLEDIPDDVLISFGIDKENPYRQLLFEANTMYASNTSHLANQWVMFSEKTKNLEDKDVYYAWNVSFDIIVEVEASKVDFIDYELAYYYESYIFLTPFYNVEYITVDSTNLPKEYVNSGLKALKETFTLTIEDEEKLGNVIIESLGTPPPAPNKKVTGLNNFANYYKVLLSMSTQVEVPENVKNEIDLSTPHITITVKTLGGKTRVMNFYLYNSRHAYYTLDGLGVSYVRYYDMERLLSATDDLVNGRVVTTEYSTTDPNAPVTGEEVPQGITSTEIILIVVLVAVILVGGGIAAFVLINSAKKNPKNKKSDKPFEEAFKKKQDNSSVNNSKTGTKKKK